MVSRQRPGRPRWLASRRVWLWTAAVVIVAVALAVLWNGSDIANTSLRTAAAQPSSPSPAPPAGRLMAAWTTATGPADVSAVEDYTVIVGGVHGLSGRDPATGRERWHYLRSTAQLCDWTAADGVVVAIFRTDDGCDEALALDAGTGARQWYRSVTYESQIAMSSTNQITVIATPTGLVTLPTTSSGTRWRYSPVAGCRIADALPGDVGVVVLLDCGAPSASMVVLDGFTGKQRWTAQLQATQPRILGADGVVTVLQPGLSSSVLVFDRDGVASASASDPAFASVGSDARPSAQLFDRLLAVFTGASVLGVNPTTGAVLWSAPAQAGPALLGSELLLLDGDNVVRRDLLTGAVLGQIPLEGATPPTGGALEQVGSAIVVSAAAEVTVYR